MAEFLIGQGVDVHVIPQEWRSCLHFALVWKNWRLAELLIARRVDVDNKNQEGATPLIYIASSRPDLGTAEKLIAAHADVNARDNGGRSALEWAALKGDSDLVNLFLKHGAEVSDDALALAKQQGWVEIVRVLTQARAGQTHKKVDN